MKRINTSIWRRGFYIIAGLCLSIAVAAGPNAAQLKTTLTNLCRQADPVLALATAMGGAIELHQAPLLAPANVKAIRHRLLLIDGSRVRMDLHFTKKKLRQVVIEVFERFPVSDEPDPERVYHPVWWLVADGACRVLVARKLNHTPLGVAISVDAMKSNLVDRQIRLPLNPPVPTASVEKSRAHQVRVAMVDSGVNYLLPEINSHLARDPQGRLLGFDYWDMDSEPFDANPAKSPFVPQRHGTRTASVLLSEAPMARIVPYRYPRPAMQRMGALVDDAAGNGVIIVNISMGSDNAREWQAFADAARKHPQMLFIASAGNNGRNIDDKPVYPAALELDNLISVGSADANGLPARGSNWGPESVDLLIPTENLIATDFNGVPGFVSGSSHAAARLSALAACILAQHPGWRAAALKKALFGLAQAPVNALVAYVKIGVLPAPPAINRGACRAEPVFPTRLGTLTLRREAVQAHAIPADSMRYRLAPITLVWIRDSGWHIDALTTAMSGASKILGQCGIAVGDVKMELLAVPRRLRYYQTGNAVELMRFLKPAAPSVWFVRDTLMQNGYEAEAIGHANSSHRRQLTDSVWMTQLLQRPDLALAHELVHLLTDSGRHSAVAGNLLNQSTSAKNTHLEDWQCERMIRVGKAFGNLQPY